MASPCDYGVEVCQSKAMKALLTSPASTTQVPRPAGWCSQEGLGSCAGVAPPGCWVAGGEVSSCGWHTGLRMRQAICSCCAASIVDFICSQSTDAHSQAQQRRKVLGGPKA